MGLERYLVSLRRLCFAPRYKCGKLFYGLSIKNSIKYPNCPVCLRLLAGPFLNGHLGDTQCSRYPSTKCLTYPAPFLPLSLWTMNNFMFFFFFVNFILAQCVIKRMPPNTKTKSGKSGNRTSTEREREWNGKQAVLVRGISSQQIAAHTLYALEKSLKVKKETEYSRLPHKKYLV